MALIQTNIFPHDVFTYLPSSKTLVAEASTLRDKILLPIYSDAADLGLSVRGKTHIVTYHLDEVKYDSHGDIVSWSFKPVSMHANKARGTTVLVFND